MAIVVHQGLRHSRRYIFEMGDPRKHGAALYLSASDKLVFTLRDMAGEPYPLEVPIGRKGLPLGEPVYLGAEAGSDGQNTIMRIIIDGKVTSERRLPFPLDSNRSDFNNFTIGARIDGSNHAEFTLREIVCLVSTLADADAHGMADYLGRSVRAKGGAIVFGAEGRPTWLTKRPDGNMPPPTAKSSAADG